MPLRPPFSLCAAALAVSTAAAIGCGPKFEPPNKVEGVRVLAVKKTVEKPLADPSTGHAPAGPIGGAYAKPGETVHFEMLYWDGKSDPDAQRTIDVTWFAGCANPPGDLYYGCFQQLQGAIGGAASSGAKGNAKVGLGATFDWTVPDDLITSRPPPADGSPPYGLSYVFFAACPGRLGPAPADGDAAGGGLPLACYDEHDQPLGPDDFVPGYTAVYAYDELRNENPGLRDLLFDGTPTERDANGDIVPVHVPRCVGDCASYDLKPDIDPSSVERDDVAGTGPDGQPLMEQMWVQFYQTRGDFDHPLRLVNDALAGWNEQNDTHWTPPSDPGPIVLWAVVHDNRGGVAWSERRVVVE